MASITYDKTTISSVIIKQETGRPLSDWLCSVEWAKVEENANLEFPIYQH